MNPAKLTPMFSGPVSDVLVKGVQEILGVENARRMFEKATDESGIQKEARWRCGNTLSTEEVAAFQHELEQTYGDQGGQGAAVRCGRAAFKYVLQHFGESAGLTDIKFRLLPTRARVRAGLEKLATLLADLPGQPVNLVDEDDHWLWKLSPETPSENSAVTARDYLTMGLLQGFLSWASGGKNYSIQLVEGENTTRLIQIGKQSLD